MVVLTTCCMKEVGRKFETEFPDDSRFSIATSVPVCEGCKNERPDTMQACDCCGEHPWVATTELGDYCGICLEARVV